ncbi:Uncharacterised protein [Bordetella pertussis]|nr:Uncharacterised protein [Bordetella pertussis]
MPRSRIASSALPTSFPFPSATAPRRIPFR